MKRLLSFALGISLFFIGCSNKSQKKEEIKPQLPLFFVNTPNSYPHFFATLQ